MSQQQQQCTNLQQAAAQLSRTLEGFKQLSEMFQGLSTLGTALAGAGEGVTFGGDTPITIGFGAATTIFAGESLTAGVAVAALNSFAQGNISALQNFEAGYLATKVGTGLVGSIPGIGDFADTAMALAAQVQALAQRADQVCP